MLRNSLSQIETTIKKSESFFKTDMIYLVKGGFWLSAGQVGSAVFAFILSIIFANYVSKETFGIYKYVISLSGILGAFTLTALPNAIIQSVARGNEGVVQKGFRINILWSALMVFGSLVAGSYYIFKENYIIGVSVIIAALCYPLLTSGGFYSSYLQGKKNFRLNSFFTLIRGFFPSLIIGVGIFFSKDHPTILITLYFLSNTIINLLLYKAAVTLYPPNNNLDPETIRFSKHSSFLNVLGLLGERLDTLLLFHYLGAAAVAIYSFAIAIPEYLNGFTKNLMPLAIPKFSTGNTEKIKDSLLRKTFILFLSLIPVTIIYAFMAPYIFKYIFPQYLDSIFYSQMYSLIIILNSAIPSSFLESQLAIKEKYMITFSTNAIKITLLFLGVFYAGIMGAVVARIAAKVIGLIISLFSAKNMKTA